MEEINSKEENLLNNFRFKLWEIMWNFFVNGFDFIEDSIRFNEKKIFFICNFL